jgi:hypothetical protein
VFSAVLEVPRVPAVPRWNKYRTAPFVKANETMAARITAAASSSIPTDTNSIKWLIVPTRLSTLPESSDCSRILNERLDSQMLSMDFPNQAPSSFHERDRVRKAAFKQHANAEMASNIRGRNEGYVLAYPEVDQVAGLDQHEQALRFRRLHFAEFPTKVLHKDIVKVVIELYWFLFDEFEALIQ